MQAEDTEWHQGTGWLRHTLRAFGEGRDPCAEVKRACSESCHALSVWKAELGYPREQVSQEILYFLGRSAAVNTGDHLDGDEALPDFLSVAPGVVVSDPNTLTGLFSFLE